MKILAPLAVCLALAFLLTGCLTTPTADSGGMGAITVTNTNVNAIIDAANDVFPGYGYTVGPASYPNSVSYDKPAGAFGKLLYGRYGVTTTVRVKLVMTPLPGTNDFRLGTRVTRVSDAGEAGFEDSQKMLGMWSGHFAPLLRKISAQAGGAGPM